MGGWLDAILPLSCTSLRDVIFAFAMSLRCTSSRSPVMTPGAKFRMLPGFLFFSMRETSASASVFGDFLLRSALSTWDVANYPS